METLIKLPELPPAWSKPFCTSCRKEMWLLQIEPDEPGYELRSARVVSIDPESLRKHYREELDLGSTKANALVAGFLFNSAKNGNVSAQIFWLKTRARWSEVPLECAIRR